MTVSTSDRSFRSAGVMAEIYLWWSLPGLGGASEAGGPLRRPVEVLQIQEQDASLLLGSPAEVVGEPGGGDV